MIDVREWGPDDTARLVRAPGRDDDKYSRGVVALRTGSDDYPGAAVLGVEAAWRAGAGFVRYAGPRRAADAVLARRPETVIDAPSHHARADAWVIGSGTDAATRTTDETETLRQIVAGRTPVVIDAGALDLLHHARAPFVATPHAREFARLEGDEVAGDRVAAVAVSARRWDGTVLLKGARTLIADAGGAMIAVDAGTGWLATAGTGDVLAGVLGMMLASNPQAAPAEAAAAAAWLHGRAACIAAGVDRGPGHPIVALDVAEALPRAIAELLA